MAAGLSQPPLGRHPPRRGRDVSLELTSGALEMTSGPAAGGVDPTVAGSSPPPYWLKAQGLGVHTLLSIVLVAYFGCSIALLAEKRKGRELAYTSSVNRGEPSR